MRWGKLPTHDSTRERGKEIDMHALSRRSFLKAAALVAGGLGLAACAPKEEVKEEIKKEEVKAPAEEIVLQLWWHEYGEAGCQEASYRIADEYSERTPGVKVESTWNPGNYNEKLYAALVAGTGPDAYESGVTIDKVVNNYAVALDEVYAGVEDDFKKADLSRVTVKGHKYGIAMMVDFQLLCTRTSMLEEAGVEHPKNWDELVEAAKATTSGRRKGLFLANDGGIGPMWQKMPWSAGVNFFMEELDTPEVRFNVEETAKAWEKLRDLQEENVLLIGAPTDWWDPAAFNQGLCAMQWIGFWSVPAIIEAVGDDYQLSALPPVPIGSNPGRYSTPRAGWIAMVNGQSKHVPEAVALQKWMWIENTDWQNEWNTGYGYKVPPRASLVASNEKLATGQPKVAADHVQEYGLFQGTLWTGAMGTACSDAVTNIVKNEADAMAELQIAYDKCVSELEKILEAYDKLPG